MRSKQIRLNFYMLASLKGENRGVDNDDDFYQIIQLQ